MKKLIIVLLAFVAMLFGCSEDTLLNDLAKSADENALQSEMLKENKGKAVTKPFKLRGAGTFEIVGEPVVPCMFELPQVLIKGEGNGTHIGLFTVEITYCTNFDNIHIAEGFQMAANGDKLFFYSNNLVNPGDVGLDEGGAFSIYHYTHGTGRFEDLSGFVKLYGIQEYTDPSQPWLGGTYTNHGEGEITY
jgi:hypothetical protein